MTMEAKWETYMGALDKTAEHLPALNTALAELDDLIFSHEHCSEGGLSCVPLSRRTRPPPCAPASMLRAMVAAGARHPCTNALTLSAS